VTQALSYINDGYQDIVDIDLRSFFDEVDHSKLLQLINDPAFNPQVAKSTDLDKGEAAQTP